MADEKDNERRAAPSPRHPLRDLDEEERTQFASFGFVKYEAYPLDPDNPAVIDRGRFWTHEQLDILTVIGKEK